MVSGDGWKVRIKSSIVYSVYWEDIAIWRGYVTPQGAAGRIARRAMMLRYRRKGTWESVKRDLDNEEGYSYRLWKEYRNRVLRMLRSKHAHTYKVVAQGNEIMLRCACGVSVGGKTNIANALIEDAYYNGNHPLYPESRRYTGYIEPPKKDEEES